MNGFRVYIEGGGDGRGQKATLLKALENATAPTKKGKYGKIRHCADLLARISSEKVRKRAKHCERFFGTIQRMVDGESP